MYDWSVAARMAPEGATAAEIAAAMGCPATHVYQWTRRAGVRLQRANATGGSFPERDARMAEMYRQGVTLQNIGRQFGLTRERARQVMKRMGLVAVGRGVRAGAALVKANQKRRAVEARVYAKWGVEYDLWRELRANGTVRAFEQQRQNSANRAVEWGLTFADWYAIWQASGKLHLRGKGKGKYCMSRIKDSGGYVLGNVHVQLITINSRDAIEKWVGKPPKQFKGVFCLYPGLEKGWLAKYSNKSLGYFPSAEAAHAARQEYMAANNLKPAGAMRGIYIQPRPGCFEPFALTRGGRQIATFATREAAAVARATMLAA